MFVMRNTILVLLPFLYSICFVVVGEESERWEVVDNWPHYGDFGQISGVSLDTAGNVWVFHRGSHVWDENTFTNNNRYRGRRNESIRQDTLIVLDAGSGNVTAKGGSGRFYIPHGLTIDHENNIWLTDVALHQVFKFPPANLETYFELKEPEIVLGQRFEPGDDDNHFCKPTDVAVDKTTGDFFVSDGYCNSKIKKFNKKGVMILSWGQNSDDLSNPYGLAVPHALSIASDGILFVADREHFRTVSYSIDSGSANQTWQEENRIYSVAYSSARGKHLYTLSNFSIHSPGVVTIYNLERRIKVGTFSPSHSFSNPHDIAISADGANCYVVELNPARVWKFRVIDAHPGTEKSHKMALQTSEGNSDEKSSSSSSSRVPEDGGKLNSPSGTLLAVAVVSFIIVLIFVIFALHTYRGKAAHPRYETRRLILDDEEEVEIGGP